MLVCKIKSKTIVLAILPSWTHINYTGINMRLASLAGNTIYVFHISILIGNCVIPMVGETGVGWDKFWLGQCLSMLNESADCDTSDVFG